MKKKLLLLFLLGSTQLFAQQVDTIQAQEIPSLKNSIKMQEQKLDSMRAGLGKISTNLQRLNDKIDSQNREVNLLKKETQGQQNNLSELRQINSKQERKIDSLNEELAANNRDFTEKSELLGTRIEESTQDANNKILNLDQTLSKSQLYWFIAIPLLLLLAAITFYILFKKIKASKTDVESQISTTKKSLKTLEEEAVKLDNKLIDVLDAQLKLQAVGSKEVTAPSSNGKEHQLALKVADEIVRMQKNILRMDQDTKGLKPLIKGLERIQNNFAANGYEMINLLHVDYEDRMNIDVINFIEDDGLEAGKKIISKVIKPQVNYSGVLIQRAQVEVSQN